MTVESVALKLLQLRGKRVSGGPSKFVPGDVTGIYE